MRVECAIVRPMKPISNFRQSLVSSLTALSLASSLTLFTNGCASDRAAAREAEARIYTPMPPAFLTGPASVLLTNGASWSAHVVYQMASALQGREGELLVSGSKMRFNPDYPG